MKLGIETYIVSFWIRNIFDGITWQRNTKGVEFLNSENVVGQAMPPLHHFPP